VGLDYICYYDEISAGHLTKHYGLVPKESAIYSNRCGTRRTFRIAVPTEVKVTVVKLEEIPPLRPLPLPGKWFVDWIDESVYDHISPNYRHIRSFLVALIIVCLHFEYFLTPLSCEEILPHVCVSWSSKGAFDTAWSHLLGIQIFL